MTDAQILTLAIAIIFPVSIGWIPRTHDRGSKEQERG
jgi:hypothetical protein